MRPSFKDQKTAQTVTGTIPGFDKPRGIVVAPSGRLAYVANIGSSTVAEVRL